MTNAQYDPFTYQPMLRYFYSQPHESSVAELSQWIRNAAPAAYTAIATRNPALLNAGTAVRSGMMGLSGLADVAQPSTDTPDTPITQWGNQLLDLAKGYFAFKGQQDLLALNIARAEKGLAPISSASLAPTVNVGVSPQVQQLGYLAVGGLVVVGLLSAFKSKRR